MSNPINISSNNRNFDPDKNEYLYKITIHFKNKKKKELVKLAFKKYIKIIKFEEEIIFNNIERFDIVIENLSNMTRFNYDSTFFSEDDEEDDLNFKTFRNTEVYVEFCKNTKKFTECNCYLNAVDNNRIFVTPPNY
jgi:hypothetical protein